MVFYCCVRKCHSTNREIQMHSFPRDPDLFYRWIQAIDREDLIVHGQAKVIKNYRVCNNHFTPESTFTMVRNRTNLKRGSIPSLFKNEAKASSNLSLTLDQPSTSYSRLDQPSTSYSSCTAEIPSSSTVIDYQPEENTEFQTVIHKKDLGRKLHILKEIGASRVVDLTPKQRHMYKYVQGFRRVAKRLFQENVHKKSLLRQKDKITAIDLVINRVNQTTLRFLDSQIKQQPKKIRGRRFSMEDKIFALSLLKQSPKGYKILRKIFALPSRKTLMGVLNKVPFDEGINDDILKSLEKQILKMDKLDRCCQICFDEMSLEASINYNKKKDIIEGFQSEKIKFADHAMVFMAKGLKTKWKQPIAYFFTEFGMHSAEIAKNLKIVITKLQSIGLTVIATVCDQCTNNTAAIKLLKEETTIQYGRRNVENRMFGFEVGGEEIIPVYDPPHLLKGVRNNLLNSDAKFTWRTVEQTASWRDVIKMYEMDSGDHDIKMCYKLTDFHIYPEKIKKMKVKYAAQVFSHKLSSTMRFVAKLNDKDNQSYLLPTAEGTADFLLFMDKLFDSVNGSIINPDSGKLLRCAVTRKSEHVKFWKEAVTVLKSITFIRHSADKSIQKEFVPPSIKNWIITLNGLELIWNRLQKLKFQFLLPRYLNQDPLENFFGNIRSHGVRNINPTCSSFTASFKSLIINNYMSLHSPGANCEDDSSDAALDCLKDFIYGSSDREDNIGAFVIDSGSSFRFSSFKHNYIIKNHAYVAGYLAKQIFKIIGVCKICRKEMITTSSTYSELNQLIESRAYSSKALLRPNTTFISLFSNFNDILHVYLPKICNNTFVKARLLEVIKNLVTNPFSCKIHMLFHIYADLFVKFYIFLWVKNINKILKGVDSKNINDSVKKIAFEKHQKAIKRKKRITELKKLI